MDRLPPAGGSDVVLEERCAQRSAVAAMVVVSPNPLIGTIPIISNWCGTAQSTSSTVVRTS